jgi:streptogramin lyase
MDGCVIRHVTAAGVASVYAGVPLVCDLNVDGPRLGGARFMGPMAIAVDSAGHIYVGDMRAAVIRKIDAGSGMVTTIAGTPMMPGMQDGSPGSFMMPWAITAEPNGTVWVAEGVLAVLRKVSGGAVSTPVGVMHMHALVDGTGTAARFQHPQGLTIDASGNLWVADQMWIRKVTPQLAVTTETTLPGNDVRALAFDSNGLLHFASGAMPAVVSMDAAKNLVRIAGDGTSGFADGNSCTAQFAGGMLSLARGASGAIYVGDPGNQRIRLIQ